MSGYEHNCTTVTKGEYIPLEGSRCSPYWEYENAPYYPDYNNLTEIPACYKSFDYMPASVLWSEIPKIILASIIILGILSNSWFYGIK